MAPGKALLNFHFHQDSRVEKNDYNVLTCFVLVGGFLFWHMGWKKIAKSENKSGKEMSEEEEELRGERWDCCVSTNYAIKCRTAPH